MSSFQKLWDPYGERPDFTPQQQEEHEDSLEVLEALQPRRGKETADWLASISNLVAVSNSGMAQPETAAEADESDVLKNEMTGWVDFMFDKFEEQANTFNQSAEGTKYTVAIQRPVYHWEQQTFENNYEPVIKVFKGHIATRTWGLLVQGHHDTIEVFVVQTDQLLSFTFNDIHSSGYKPFMVIQSARVNNQLEWNIEGGKVTHDMLPLLCKELLGDLIRITTGSMSEDELFAHHHTDLKLGETVAQGFESEAALVTPVVTAPQAGSPAQSGMSATSISSLATWLVFQSLWKAIDADFQTLTTMELQATNNEDQDAARNIRGLAASLLTLKVDTQDLLKKHTEKSPANV
jgi:hypothetical protein